MCKLKFLSQLSFNSLIVRDIDKCKPQNFETWSSYIWRSRSTEWKSQRKLRVLSSISIVWKCTCTISAFTEKVAYQWLDLYIHDMLHSSIEIILFTPNDILCIVTRRIRKLGDTITEKLLYPVISSFWVTELLHLTLAWDWTIVCHTSFKSLTPV